MDKRIIFGGIILIVIILCSSSMMRGAPMSEKLENVQETIAVPVPETTGSEFKAVDRPAGELVPEELLPKYQDKDKFAEENPITSLLKDQNFLISGYHYGINTVLQSNKIPYHDIRSLPPIPKESVGPWNQSSFDEAPGQGRKQFEIGQY
jgi:hypothetical protein